MSDHERVSHSTSSFYLCAWHLYFHARARPATSILPRNETPHDSSAPSAAPPAATVEAQLQHVLEMLGGIGYHVAPLQKVLFVTEADHRSAALAELEAAKQEWLQQTKIHSSEDNNNDNNREDEEERRSWQQNFYFVCAAYTLQQLQHGAATAAATALPQLLAEASTTLPGPSWDPVVDFAGAPSAVFTLRPSEGEQAATAVWQEARQYAALAFASGYRAPALLAKLLLLYALGSPAATTEAAVRAHQASRATAAVATRLKGVVSGVVEVALRVAAGASRRTSTALERLVRPRSTASAPAAGTWRALAVAPAAEDSAAVADGAALVLSALANEAQQLDELAGTGEDKGLGAAAAREVVHQLQELLFTLVLGAGTTHMTTRPAAGAAASHVATRRPLLLPEADTLTLHLFPALLQQVGFEWPWSALLRHCRALDKQQRPAAYPAVAWASAVVFDTLLAAVATRTYGERLQQFLPGSYDRLLSALGLLPEEGQTAAGDGGDEEQQQQQPTTTTAASLSPKLFQLPAYYRDAAQPVVKYLAAAGLGGVVLEELELALERAVGALPMLVQLRALAATNGHPSPTQSTSRRLTPERVEELAERYKGEVLLAAVVAHTQLQVPSHVQELMRLLAPLFTKVALALGRHDSGGSAPLLAEGGGAFTAEAELLMEHVGYQFYALEWLPAYTQWSLQKGGSASQASTSSGSGQLPYSLFAAVAYQYELQLRDGPGSAGSGTLRLPCGVRADVVTPDLREATSLDTWRRTRRYLESLLELSYLDARTSGSDLEGMLSTMSQSRADTTSGGGAATSAALGSLRRLVASVPNGPALLTELLQPPAFPAAPAGEEEGRPPAKKSKAEAADEAAVLTSLSKLFLLHGATSFEATVEIKDILFTVLQCFLPPLAQLHVGKSLSIASPAAGKRPTAQLLALAQSSWCHNVLVSTNVHTKLHQQPQDGGGEGSHAAAPYEQRLHATAARAYNSVTLDGCALAREVLRRAPLRLLHKMQARLAQETAFYHIIQRHQQSGEAEEEERQPPTVDTLLSLQWTQWRHYMQQLLGVLPPRPQEQQEKLHRSPRVEPDQVLAYFTAAQYTWFSPYVLQEMSAVDFAAVSE